MKILVLNGSPKGKYSITLQTILYLEEHFPKHTFEVIHAGQRIKSLEKDFSPMVKAIDEADLLLFSYPVYTFLAPYQLHRFIELLKSSGISLEGKFATQITTSKHFYDVTAHRYIQDNCQDMKMKFIRGLSADMEDLLSKKGQIEALDFFKYVCWSVKNNLYEPLPEPLPAPNHIPVEVPAETTSIADHAHNHTAAHTKISGSGFADIKPARHGDVVIVTDCEPENRQLGDMIKRFQSVFPLKTRVVNIREYPFKGGCLGCFHCAVSGNCIYKDGFDDFLRGKIQTADAIVYAFSIKDHSMGAAFKQYDDRQFCNGHRTVNMGMPIAYLVSGNYSREFNLQMILEARAQVGRNFLAGIATDETDPNHAIDQMASTLAYAMKNKYVPPQNFYGIGGMKIFRDLIWQMQGMMKADHKFYKAHGQYDFPQKKWPTMLKMYAVGALLSSPKLKAKMGNKMNEGMLMPYENIRKRTYNKNSSKD